MTEKEERATPENTTFLRDGRSEEDIRVQNVRSIVMSYICAFFCHHRSCVEGILSKQ